MEINDFIQHFTEQFDDVPEVELLPETNFRELDEWSSFTALCVMAMVEEEYDVQLNAAQMRQATTIQELFDIVKANVND